MSELELIRKPERERTAPFAGAHLPPPPSPSPLAGLDTDGGPGQAAGFAHDARNLLSAIHLYCELLAGPGVLAPRFRHYARDLKRVGETGARLIEALAGAQSVPSRGDLRTIALPRAPFPPIEDLAAEVLAMGDLLRALAGPGVRLEIECLPCAGALGINSEDLLRILFNLIANAVEAIHGKAEERAANPPPGLLRLTVQRGGAASFLPPKRRRGPGRETIVLSLRDNGPGIAPGEIGHIFAPGYSTRPGGDLPEGPGDGPGPARGLGLAIVRQLAEAAGGAVRAVSMPGLGTRFDIELPILSGFALPSGGRPGRTVRGRNAPGQNAPGQNTPGPAGPAPLPGRGLSGTRKRNPQAIAEY